ncbi:MAG: hypothetical protein GY757_32465, partial [bacterium]|nr:hypothetical protein [bacterium]
MNPTRQLLYRLKQQDIVLRLVDKKLKITAPEGRLTPSVMRELREKKQNIIDYLEKRVQHRQRFFTIPPTEKKSYYPLSSAQKRMYFLQQFNLTSTMSNIPTCALLNERIDVKKVETAIKRLIRHHESLRTSFRLKDGQPVQCIRNEVDFRLEYDDVTPNGPGIQDDKVGKAIVHRVSRFIRPFNLSHAPLLRVALFKTGENNFILVQDIHHIVSDGISNEILIKDFSVLYHGKELPPLRIQYKDYSQWRSRHIKSAQLNSQETYWLQEYKAVPQVLDLPMDYPRPAVRRFEGDVLSWRISKHETRDLKAFVLKQGCTLFTFLLATLNILASKLSGNEDIVIGTPVSGRRHADLENIIGMFVNTLPLRNYPMGEKTFLQFLAELNRKTLSAFDNQDYPFEELVEKTGNSGDATRNPMFDIMLVYRNTVDTTAPSIRETTPEVNALDSPYDDIYGIKNRYSRFDMTFIVTEGDRHLEWQLEYNINLFKKETVERFFQYFRRILNTVQQHPVHKIADIDILSPEEKKRILVEFNDTQRVFPESGTI